MLGTGAMAPQLRTSLQRAQVQVLVPEHNYSKFVASVSGHMMLSSSFHVPRHTVHLYTFRQTKIKILNC